MKSNSTHFVFNWFNSLLVAIAIVIFAAIKTANAQSNVNVPTSVLNGLFSPTQSERFFQAGREDFEREIAIFNDPERYLNGDLLRIDPELIEQMNQLQPPDDFGRGNFQYELHLDSDLLDN